MRNPRQPFADVDRMPAPDLWEEARRRSSSPRSMRLGPEPPSRARRVVAGTVAFAVFAAGSILAWSVLRPQSAPLDDAPSVQEPDGPLDGLAPGWTELPPPPDVRTGAAMAWTGSELLVWGGYVYTGFSDEEPLADGYSLDPLSGKATPLPPAPLSARSFPASAWTGSELLVWGGWDGTWTDGQEERPGVLADGAAYDPVSGTWRMLPQAPVTARAPLSVWTGSELLVWGTSLRDPERPRDGAAYDPGADRWRSIADAPIELTDATAVWTGDELIAFGAALHGGNVPESETAIGAAYDPGSDAWRLLPDSELSPQASTAAWNGTEMIAWDYRHAAAAYDPRADRWRRLPRVPLDDFECSPQSAAVAEGFVFGDYCGLMALYDPSEDAWRDVSLHSYAGWAFDLLGVGDAVLLLGRSVDTSDEVALAYRPGAAESSVDGTGGTEPTPFVPPAAVSDGVARVEVTFPDGSSASITYPAELDLARLGFQPDVSYVLADEPAIRHPIVFLHGPPGVERAYVEGDEPHALFALPDGGEAALWRAADIDSQRLKDVRWWLAYRTASWTVLCSLGAEEDAEVVTSSLSVSEAETGFPFIVTSVPITLPEFYGEDEGPGLTIGDAFPDPDIATDGNLVILAPQRCEGGREFDPDHLDYYGSSCLADGMVFAHVYGETEFIRAVLDGLRVAPFSSP